LVVEDDPGVRAALVESLGMDGFGVRQVSTGEAALAEVEAVSPDVMVLDIALPGISGVDVVSSLRAQGLLFPVCILSARDKVEDRVSGLAAGADDYVVKPFSITELCARLHALVRLHQVRHGLPLALGDIVINFANRAVTRAGKDIAVTAREFDLLAAFARHPNQVLSRYQLLELVWGYTWDVETNVVDVFVGYLRRKLEAAGEHRVLHTVRGVGFVMRP
jgi:DNA-binding response OmpR family regulator